MNMAYQEWEIINCYIVHALALDFIEVTVFKYVVNQKRFYDIYSMK